MRRKVAKQMGKRLAKVEEVAEALGLGKTKVYELLGTGEIARVKIGRAVRVPWASVEEWIDRQVERTWTQDGHR